jgi:anti-sigma regulatory factor (Ser/Thr protein kinase)
MGFPCARLSAPALADEVGRMRRAASAAAAEQGLGGRALEHLELAVSEALTNIVLHAYANEPGPMSVEVESDAEAVRVTVADDGRGIAAQAEHRGPGMGLGILASAADFCEIRSRRGFGVQVMLGFEREALDD